MTVSRRDFLAGSAGGAATFALAGCGGEPATDVIVIGAGLAGLHAARLLEKQGARVTVLEASNRVGGRVETLFDAEGTPEMGAADVGTVYTRILATVEELGLQVKPWPGGMPSYWFHFQGQGFTADQWPELAINPFEGKRRKVNPSGVAQAFMPRPNPLPDLGAWLQAEFTEYDVPYGRFLAERGASEEALKYALIGQQYDSLDDLSTLWMLRAGRFTLTSMETAFAQGKPIRYFVDGGMGRLTNAMAASLRGDVRLNHRVTAIEHSKSDVKVTCENGEQLRARFVICTAPFTIVRNIAITPMLPPLMAEAIQQIPYGQATSVILNISGRYWEEDGLPANMWTDLPIERAFINPSTTGDGEHLWVFTTGAGDLARRGLTDDEMGEFVISELNRVRPSTVGRLETVGVRSWTRDPTTLGTYAARAPGQITRYGRLFAEPAGRLVFAGEHTAELNLGIEGAMESGEAAANTALAAI